MLSDYLQQFDDHVKFLHTTRHAPFNVQFHLHRGCEIFFLVRGDVNYFVDKTVYPLQYGDVIITNEHEIHKPAFLSDAVYERVTLEFNPALIDLFRTDAHQPLRCFYDRPPGETNKIRLGEANTAELTGLFANYNRALQLRSPEAPLVKLSCLLDILLLVHRGFYASENKERGMDLPQKLSPVLAYLDRHLADDLSLERLEKLFFISKYHLSRLFKAYTGSTVHQYIVYKRIALAKKLLKEGSDVTAACLGAGFNDYSGFLRTFKKTVGMLPKDYAKRPAYTSPIERESEADAVAATERVR